MSTERLFNSMLPAAPGQKEAWTWWFRFCLFQISGVNFLVGFALLFGPKSLFASNSLMYIHQYTRIPWPLWAFAFFMVGLMILFEKTRKFGYAIGAALAAVFVVASVIWTVIPGKTTNPIIIGFSTLAIPMNIAGAKYTVQREARKIVQRRIVELESEVKRQSVDLGRELRKNAS